MSRSHHRGFPVLENNRLVGIITQSDLPEEGSKQGKTLLREIMTPHPISVNPATSLADVLYLLNRYQLSRLPVTEGNRLLGIITRSDIIKAEAQQLNCDRAITAKPEPSYLVYRTRSPTRGRGRILLPISNPENISALMTIAMAIANYRQYEIECLQVIAVPNYVYPAQAKVDLTASRELMQRLENWGDDPHIPIHTQIRVATDVGEAILETIAKEHITLLLMGWKGKTYSPEQIFGSVVDTLIKQASCDLMLVKLGKSPHAFPHGLNRRHKWLIPTAGGNNIQKAMTMLPALDNLYTAADAPIIELCQVCTPSQDKPTLRSFQQNTKLVKHKMNLKVKPLLIRAYSVPEAIVQLTFAKKYSLVILGASNEGLLQNTVKGNIPEAIARNANSTVIIFRSSL